MSALRVAVCGFGWFGGVHARCWSSIPGVELVGLADPVFAAGERSERAAQEAFHRDAGSGAATTLDGVARFTSVEAMLAAVQPDLVDVTTHEEAHVPVALTCLEAGAHVVVEKPAALDPADVARLARAAEQHRRLALPAHVLRFDARYAAVRERVRAAHGRLHFISTQRHFQAQAHAVYGRVHPALNALIHDIDVAIWLAGGSPDRVSGYQRMGADDDGAPRVVSAILEWRDGPSALLENAWHLVDGMSSGYEFRCTVMHDDFTAIVAPAADVAVFERDGVATFADVHLWPELPYGVAGALRAELMHFATCAREHRPSPIVDLGDAERAVGVAAAVVRSLQEEGWVDVAGA